MNNNKGRGKSRGGGKGGRGRGGNQANPKSNNNKAAPNGKGKGNKPRTNNSTSKQQQNNGSSDNTNKHPSYTSYQECMRRYVEKDVTLIRGKLRVLPAKDGMAFCACDRGSQKRDVLIESPLERNRGMNGDMVFVELLPEEEDDDMNGGTTTTRMNEQMANLKLSEEEEEEAPPRQATKKEEFWQDDSIQMKLWNPIVPIKRITTLEQAATVNAQSQQVNPQRRGRVIHVCKPAVPKDALQGTKAKRIMVGTLRQLQSGTCLFTPNDKTLPQFKCNNTTAQEFRKELHNNDNKDSTITSDLYRAEYLYHAWQENHNWPPCVNVKRLGKAYSIEDQIQGLLMEHQVDHGEFHPDVLKDVENAVQSGVYLMQDGTDTMGWKPTPEMYKGRRDYRTTRIFTIDPTTAKDLDDALHITQLPNGQIELGVHIADVSAFVLPKSHVDHEALRRATTVYLVDRTVPMLPKPLCEIACSLNENVERLAFSCVWKMNPDGSMVANEKVWYGRTVIKSCARLDYATAQNIIDGKVSADKLDDALWPPSRRPTGGHTIQQVVNDVKLMHKVAMERRRLRFSNGALALHGVKLTFQLDEDGETPLKCAPYPIKDSNRLVEEYMLLANYLVAQRLITHSGNRAVLRRHPDPLPEGLQKVVDIAKVMFDFEVDASSSASLHASLVRLGRVCNDEVFLKSMTQMLTTPMQNADYFSAGAFERELWRHFALNIPYYTHFTSPIRRYADVLVHRLLQATIDGEEAVKNFPLDAHRLNDQCEHCNEKRLASKMAQERCDVVFLALYLRRHPMKGELGIVMSLGNKAFTVFVPNLGVNAMVFLEEHKDWLEYSSQGDDHDRRIVLTRKPGGKGGPPGRWSRLNVKMFTKISVSCMYKDKPRVDVKLVLEGPAPANS